jgi:hypothetical protein
MHKPFHLMFLFFVSLGISATAQTKEDSAAITRAALDYIESQHKPNAAQMEGALHQRLVKRTFWNDKATGKDFLYEYFAENMIILAERYDAKGDKFPANTKKEVKLLDISDRTASIKLIADDWIDYMHLTKLNSTWKIVNVLWQFNDQTKHQ